MEIILPVFVIILAIYVFFKPRPKIKKKDKVKTKKFGEGLLQDNNAYDWWKPGDGGI